MSTTLTNESVVQTIDSNPYILKGLDILGNALHSWPLLFIILTFIFRKKLTLLLDLLTEKIGKAEEMSIAGLNIKAGKTTVKENKEKSQGEINETLKEMSIQVISTLWYYQKKHYEDKFSVRWTFKPIPQKTDHMKDYLLGCAELYDLKLIDFNEDYMCFLTNAGIKYCKNNGSSLKQFNDLIFKFEP